MRREHHRWFSPTLHRNMELLVFGHSGARLLVFPTSLGRFFEWEDRQMTDALRDHLDQGWLQMFCVDSVDAESWYAKHKHPGERAWRHDEYDRYIYHEVLPFTNHYNSNPFLIVTGASFGAYHAANFAFRHPEKVSRIIALSGVFEIKRFTDGFYNETIYFHNPVDYLNNEHDPWRLELLRRMDIILGIGRDDPNRGNCEYLSGLLWGKGIGNALRLWDGWSHDWPYWQKMIRTYVGGHD
jgi:esterase/lipase superfamily enzyme